ncbi:hypothetical protein DFA_01413 [Cavenderia fasciculata]|uniref:Uncharacterized protein n=1 Tax=Cavenderia fasciculata TaxID=261658 RepID=F4PSJ7_CACFS|nr:uncharacterized protein DFA_01413 [Cavenderia fasciculata]EGG21527.1 hypothetical protein DFA_01413 [Cavenderia fasciculata]|eukprot:XP_004359377.1 hypothetical protein DFA_01413 [Cavenderia fasciculata]
MTFLVHHIKFGDDNNQSILYYSDGKAVYQRDGVTLWYEDWSKDWAVMKVYRDGTRFYLFSYRPGSGAIDLISDAGAESTYRQDNWRRDWLAFEFLHNTYRGHPLVLKSMRTGEICYDAVINGKLIEIERSLQRPVFGNDDKHLLIQLWKSHIQGRWN